MMKNIQIIFVLNLCQLISSNVLRLEITSPSEDQPLFKETEFIEFSSSKLTSGSNAIKQLDCYDSLDQDEAFCAIYEFKTANCTNLNYEKHFYPMWQCTFNECDFDETVNVNTVSIDCEYPNKFNRLYKLYYLNETCYLRYTLKRLKPDPEEDQNEDEPKDDDDLGEGDEDEPKIDRKKLLIYLYLLIGCLSSFFFVISIFYLVKNLKAYGFKKVFCCCCSRSSFDKSKGFSSTGKSYSSGLRTGGFDMSTFKSSNTKKYVNADIALTTFA